MEAALTDLTEQQRRLLYGVLHEGQTLILKDGDEPVAKVESAKIDRAQAFEDLRAIGPVEIPLRK
ncbi:MAG: hypothetical protein HC841_09300 [Verrucomicrobiae bacterium]|nr:hypothetical protein [Verrucomicrobiae bacterium]